MSEDAPYSTPFWEALAEGDFLLQTCEDCEYAYFPPAPVCPECHGDDVTWTGIDPTGEVYAYTRQHRTAEGFESPVVLATVDLDAGPRLLVRMDDEYQALEIGAPVEIRPVEYDGGLDRGWLADYPFFRGVLR
jgi:uncharacterized OB-fold protein